MIPATNHPPILITGGRGMLGRDLTARLGERAVALDLPECDITQPDSIARALDEYKPASIVNCAAYTAVDKAEEQEELARRLNADAVELLARAAKERGIHFVSISTDYVFHGHGEEPFPEDAPESAFGPLSIYGRTKLEGELKIRAVGGDWAIVRTQWLYGRNGKNFIDSIAELAASRDRIRVVNDQVGAATWTVDLAEGLEKIVDARATGVYHIVNSGYGSWFDVASRVVQNLKLNCIVEPCTSDEFPRPAARPHNSRLLQTKYAALAGAPLRPWTEAVDEYLSQK
ncbi:MAG: dTDP-4-dehydrorhamnose reductase [Candidatus Sumerlaeia bacterium]